MVLKVTSSSRLSRIAWENDVRVSGHCYHLKYRYDDLFQQISSSYNPRAQNKRGRAKAGLRRKLRRPESRLNTVSPEMGGY